jgi:hypothetical protein
MWNHTCEHTFIADTFRCGIHACEWIVGFAKYVVGVILYANQENGMYFLFPHCLVSSSLQEHHCPHVACCMLHVDQRLSLWLDGWMVGWLDGWMVGWLDGWMVGWLDGWMVGCTVKSSREMLEFDRSFRLGLYDWDKSFLPGLQDMLRRVIVILLFHPLHHTKILEDIVQIFQKEKDAASASKLEDWIKNPLASDESFRSSATSFRTREFLALVQVLHQMEEVAAMGSVNWPLLSKTSFSSLAKSGFAIDHDTLSRMAIEGSYYHSLDDSLCECVSFRKTKAPRMLQFDGFTKTAIQTAPCMRCVRCGRLCRKNDDARLWPFRAFSTTCRWCDGPLMVISQFKG